jgi:hypothetical protein
MRMLNGICVGAMGMATLLSIRTYNWAHEFSTAAPQSLEYSFADILSEQSTFVVILQLSLHLVLITSVLFVFFLVRFIKNLK